MVKCEDGDSVSRDRKRELERMEQLFVGEIISWLYMLGGKQRFGQSDSPALPPTPLAGVPRNITLATARFQSAHCSSAL